MHVGIYYGYRDWKIIININVGMYNIAMRK